ncbi:hypothetical protein D3C81_1752830 [compost metagenome]
MSIVFSTVTVWKLGYLREKCSSIHQLQSDFRKIGELFSFIKLATRIFSAIDVNIRNIRELSSSMLKNLVEFL